MSSASVFFVWGLKNEFEIAVVNEPLVFKPLKFYCNLHTECKLSFGPLG